MSNNEQGALIGEGTGGLAPVGAVAPGPLGDLLPTDAGSGDLRLGQLPVGMEDVVSRAGAAVALDEVVGGDGTNGSSGDRRASLEATLGVIGQAETGEADRSKEVFALRRNPDNYFEILVESKVTLEQYKERTQPEIWDLMLEETEHLVGKSLVILSSTYEGGGVAMQEPPLVNFLRLRGVNARWLVSERDDAAFLATKKMHNLQQDMLPSEIQWTPQDSEDHVAYGKKNIQGMLNGKELTPEEVAEGRSYGPVEGFAEADIYWFEDPQLIGGLKDVMALNPSATYVYRNHIQTDKDLMANEDSPQNRIYRHIHQTCGVDMMDTYVSHPVAQFVPNRAEGARYQEAYMPPVSDDFEDLIRDLTPEEIAEKQEWINGQIAKQNAVRRVANAEVYGEADPEVDDQGPIDWGGELITDFARYDFAKFHECAMMLQVKIVDKMRAAGIPDEEIPRAVIAGNGATDDGDREEVLREMLVLRRTKYADYSKFITVIGLEHDYTAVNALLRSSKYSGNYSLKEGFEHRRTESMMKGVPSISSNRGGLPLQGRDGEGGMVMDYGPNLENLEAELDRVATEILLDKLHPERYDARRAATIEWTKFFSWPELTTVANVIREAAICNGRGSKEWYVRNLAAARAERAAKRAAIGSLAVAEVDPSLN